MQLDINLFLAPQSLNLKKKKEKKDEPWETMDSKNQTEGFRREGIEEWVSLVMGI